MYERLAGIKNWPYSIYTYVNDYAYITMSYPLPELLRLMWAGFGQFSYIFKVGDRTWREDAHEKEAP